MIDSYKDIQDVLSVAGYTQNGLQAIDHRGEEIRDLQQGRSGLFDGVNDYGVSGVDASFQTATNQFSMVADLKLTGAGGTVFNKVLAAGGWDSYLFRLIAANTMQIVFTNGTNFVGFNIPVANIPTTLNRIVLRWVCTAGTVADCRAWVNAAEVSVTIGTSSGYTSAFLITYINSPLSVGGRRLSTGTYAEYANCELANLFVWNSGLAIADCIRLSDRTKPILQLPNLGNLMFGYKFDEGDGILAINSLGLGGATDLTLNNIVPINFHQQRTDGYGADWQNQFGFTPSMRFLGTTGTSGIALNNTPNSKFWQHTQFTFECYFVCTSIGSAGFICGDKNTGAAGEMYIYMAGGSRRIQIEFDNGAFFRSPPFVFSQDVEYHIRWVREGTGVNQNFFYVNGILNDTFTCANTAISTQVMNIGKTNQNVLPHIGWMRNVIMRPSAIVGAFTAPTTWADYQALEATNPSKLAIYTQNIVNNPLSIPITFTDATSLLVPRNENNISLDAFGRPLFYRNRAKYNAQLRQSNCLTSSVGSQWVRVPFSNDFGQFGTGDFYIGAYCFYTTGQDIYIFGNNPVATVAGNSYAFYYATFNNSVEFFHTNGTIGERITLANFSTLVQNNTTNHIAVCRNGNVFRLFLNGIEMVSATITRSLNTDNLDFGIFGEASNGSYFSQTRITALQIVKGSGVYTSSFKPSLINYNHPNTVAFFPMQEGAGDRVFSKVNGHIGTLNNFAFPTAWANKQDVINSNLIQGFDKAVFTRNLDGGARVNYANIAMPLSFTIDFWFYNKNANEQNTYFSYWQGGAASGLQIWSSTGGLIAFQFYSGGSSIVNNVGLNLTANYPLNQWNHLAFVVDNTNYHIYANGNRIATGTCATTRPTPNAFWSFGSGIEASDPSWGTDCYFSNVRYSNTGLYIGATYTMPSLESDYANTANTIILVRGDEEVMGRTVTITNADVVRKPITATNPQTQSNPAGTFHNGSEVILRQPLVPALIRLDVLNTFFTAGVANALAFANLPNNVSNLGKITCKTSVANRRSNLKVYRGFN
jgi:hypothetical protein